MSSPSLSWVWRAIIIILAVLLSILALESCSEPERKDVDHVPTDLVDEMTAHKGKVCPKQLPQGEDPGNGFGTFDAAVARPSLLEPEAAWVCEYYPIDAGPAADGRGIRLEWVRDGQAAPVDADQLPALARDLAKLAPALKEQLSCTDDLGSRWMLVYSHDKDLTGVVLEDFGCDHVRLTDDPFSTEPGAGSQAGTVPGVLVGPVSLLAAVKTVHPS